jgi:Mrp family chromosome partitioning ATPase
MLAGQRVLKAHTFRGKSFTGEVHLHDWFVPVLFQEEQDPQLIREVPAGQVAAVIATQRKMSLGAVPEEPAHQFLGRSRDLLKAERILARERYLVVQGSGGEGKTTFAAELAR